MSYFAGILIMALLAVIQSSVLARFPFLDGTPTLILLACVSWTLTGRVLEAMAFAFSGGLFLDLLSGAPFGASAMALVACVYLASLSEGRFWEAHPLAPLGVVAAASSAYYAVTIAALWLAGRPIDPSLAL